MVYSQKWRVGLLSGLMTSTTVVALMGNSTTPVVAQSASTGFVTPSGNISCLRYENTLRCEIQSGLNPKPPQPYPGYCDFDWGLGFSLNNDGKPKILCISDTIAGGNYPTLSYGSTWKNAGFKCVSQKAGLTCTNASGQGFFLSRDRWKILTNR
ncbi:MAG TPA: DUF6636 domain-containing protein [Stenomitos sp.]